MAGLYIHVPFCRSRCIYCDFYSTVSGEEWKARYRDALLREMTDRSHEVSDQSISTIYLGGGTPSQLPIPILQDIFLHINKLFHVTEDAEVTIEANPDDISEEWLEGLRHTPVNRISMGVQTFSDNLLQLLRRRHTAEQAIQAAHLCQEHGYRNISIDLIYGLPRQSMEMWEEDVRQALSLGVKHLSAYALSYEEDTPLSMMLRKEEVQEADEELSLRMYRHLMNATAQAGMEHYEISNFALPDFRSRHNSSYWKGVAYLGLGPGAHSFDGVRTRRQNEGNLNQYVCAKEVPHQTEVLTDEECYEEKVLTRLRTSDGLPLSILTEQQREYCLQAAAPHLKSGKLSLQNHTLRLTKQGIFVSNDIISDMMY